VTAAVGNLSAMNAHADTAGDDSVQVVVTVNGPGEVACWLYPLATELKRQIPGVRICVAVVPCTFSTGSEITVIKELPYVDASCSIAETKALILRNKLPDGFARKGRGFIIHLGGDSVFTWLLSLRLGLPCFAYAERPLALQSRFEDVWYSGFEEIRGAAAKDAKIVGEMMVDAANMRVPDRAPLRDGAMTVGLYPGSRDYLAKYFLPFYAAIAEEVAKTHPQVEWMLAKSDFLSLDFLRNLPSIHDGRPLDAVELRYEEAAGRQFLVTPKGIRIGIGSADEVGQRAKVALSLPGSNTAELSAIGLPMIITLPTWWTETAPLPGLAGHVGRIPLLGKYIKRFLSYQVLKRLRFLSHPNRRTGRMVVPEVLGRITAPQVAEVVRDYLDRDTRPLEDELRAIMGPPGATKRFVSALTAYLKRPAERYETA